MVYDIKKAIEHRISELAEGDVFVPADFFDITTPVNVNNILSRLCKAGTIRRCFRGVYAKPYFSSVLDRELMPKPDDVIAAIARRHRWTIAPSGDTALNRIGLSTQIPAVLEFVSSGPDKTYSYGGFMIKLRHRANKDMIGNSPITRVFIQAMKALGNGRVLDETMVALAEKLSREQIETIVEETVHSAAWIAKVARQIEEAIK
ncbi:MAG: DUF6088 family protein [Coriobacteriia bacterium]|nr:DUF6088 family protein [Coriobacteriia bacterium]